MDQELYLSKDTMIVSETDLKGIITYANDDFCKLCGFTKEELIGKPHNIIRHPDMPKWAFQSLWDTIKQNKSWQGIVKNRTKDGDYYWVNATAYKINKDNGDQRYVSIRVKPTKDEIVNATNLYRQKDVI